MFRKVEGLFEARLKRDLKTVPSRKGLMSLHYVFFLHDAFSPFKRGASCGSHDFLGSARGWGLTLR